MRTQIFLHIGMHKTGTTFLQNLFRRRRKQLLQADSLLFPETGLPLTEDVSPKLDGFPGHNQFVRISSRKTMIGKLAAEIATCSPDRVFISAENLSNVKFQFCKPLVEDLELIGSVSIILVVRRQDKWIESYYRQRVAGNKKGETRDFWTFLKEEGPLLLDYGVRYQQWRQTPFSGKFFVASYDDLTAHDALMRWFCEILQVSNSGFSLHLDKAPTYPSLTRLDTEITRLVNLIPDLAPAKRNELLRHIYRVGILADAPFVSDDLYEELRKCYEPKNKKIVDEWAIHPASEFINWRRTEEQVRWDVNLSTISSKLTAASDGLADMRHTTRRKKRLFELLKTTFG